MARQFAKKFYASGPWKDLRAYVLIRDHYLCQVCGSSGHLEVHHKIHLSEHNINDVTISLNPDNLITLCRDCHFNEHKAERIEAVKRDDCGMEYYFDENGYLVERK